MDNHFQMWFCWVEMHGPSIAMSFSFLFFEIQVIISNHDLHKSTHVKLVFFIVIKTVELNKCSSWVSQCDKHWTGQKFHLRFPITWKIELFGHLDTLYPFSVWILWQLYKLFYPFNRTRNRPWKFRHCVVRPFMMAVVLHSGLALPDQSLLHSHDFPVFLIILLNQ